MSDFVNITSADRWFKKHPEKIAGVEFESTSFMFPIQVKGDRSDVERVINATLKNSLKSEHKDNLKATAEGLTYEEWKIESKKWDDYTNELSDKVNSVSEKGEMGLSKRTPEFIQAKRRYDAAFKKYQKFNKSTPKGFSKRKFDEKIEKSNQKHKRLKLAKAKAKALKLQLLVQ